MASVTLYTRVGCHLCDAVKSVLDEVRPTLPFDLSVVDIDADPDLVAEYGLEVPVVAINGREAFRHRVDPNALRERLSHADATGAGRTP